MKDDPLRPFDLNRLSRYGLKDRPSKVSIENFGKPSAPGMSFSEFAETIPEILAGSDIKEFAGRIARARAAGRSVHLAMGAHVLKVGLAPMLIDLLERGVITGLSVNGAVLVHDFEIAAAGKTSEDVDDALGEGLFGMAQETGRDLSGFVSEGDKLGQGLAECVAHGIAHGDYPHKEYSLLAAASKNKAVLTAHPALGTDILHLWPDLDWAAMGRCAQRDFLTFISAVEKMKGGVYINAGSAVVLPEIFLKAVTAARNAGADHSGITTANFDFIQHYRPLANVVRRPTKGVGKGFAFTGHHEIMLPLLFALVLDEMRP